MLAISATLFGAVTACPGSGFPIHAGANFDVAFTNSCEEVAAEIKARAAANAGLWQDPHNHGHYSLLESTGDSYILTQRQTKSGRYTDKQTFNLTPSGSGCSVVACSESQGLSAADGGTNFCDMFDLFCNSKDCDPDSDENCCKVLKYDLTYTISEKKCYPFFFNCPANRDDELKTCLRMPSTGTAKTHQLERMEAFSEDLEGKKKAKGKCMNEKDEKLFPSIVPDMQACGKVIKKAGYRGLNALHHFKLCMQNQHGFTKECTECSGTFVACKVLHCTKKCGSKGGKPMQLWKEPCFECVGMCAEKMTKCAGIDDVSFTKCQSLMTGQLSWVCSVLAGKMTIQQVWKELEPVLKPHTNVDLDLAELFEIFEDDLKKITF